MRVQNPPRHNDSSLRGTSSTIVDSVNHGELSDNLNTGTGNSFSNDEWLNKIHEAEAEILREKQTFNQKIQQLEKSLNDVLSQKQAAEKGKISAEKQLSLVNNELSQLQKETENYKNSLSLHKKNFEKSDLELSKIKAEYENIASSLNLKQKQQKEQSEQNSRNVRYKKVLKKYEKLFADHKRLNEEISQQEEKIKKKIDKIEFLQSNSVKVFLPHLQ